MAPFAPSFISLRILVVEPDRDLGLTFDTILGHDGHTVTITRDLASATREISKQDFEFAFIDTRVGAHGIEALCDALKKGGHDCPVVLIAGMAEHVDGATLHLVGGEAVLPTPFGAVGLRGAIARVYGPRYIAALKAEREAAKVARQAV